MGQKCKKDYYPNLDHCFNLWMCLLILSCPHTFLRMSISFTVASLISWISCGVILSDGVMSMIFTAYSWDVRLSTQRRTTLLTPLKMRKHSSLVIYSFDGFLLSSEVCNCAAGLKEHMFVCFSQEFQQQSLGCNVPYSNSFFPHACFLHWIVLIVPNSNTV